MGVPKFFRWLSERYPCLGEELKEYQIPEFDNLYLDMNGIIHVCSHPNDFDPHFRISEEQIFKDIFHYIEVIFRLIRPKKLFFMAVDGVAPRAKMNQQRGRRFSSAREAEILEKKAMEKGEALPSEKRFDSNCITPGTQFMARLQEQLKYFVASKMSNDKLWQQPTVILSGHSVPGEGEHKIMDYIRYLRSKPDWDPYTRHCLYGLDADLIILGLCTHEPNFSLLREEVKYNKSSKSSRTVTPETTNFLIFHLSLLRGYLELEFHALKAKLPFPFDIERIIDDWVLMGFLVGNDFIPHLPHLHIHCNALGVLYDTYRTVLPKLDGYINENGVLNLSRFEQFLIELSEFDKDHFSETYTDMKYFESKTGRKMFPDIDIKVEDGGRKVRVDEDALQALIASTQMEMFDFGDEDAAMDEALEPEGLENMTVEGEEDKLFCSEFRNHKRDYYINKMEYPDVSEEVLRREAGGYVKALQWILFYYYRGCQSWSWYYPHHYSPYVSDLRGFSGLDIEFDMGKPFLPFQQLLAVLPAASSDCLPPGYRSLMSSDQSPIIDYYPKDFKLDLNGKRQEWEAVVLIPFIEEKRLLEAMNPFNDELTTDEIERNTHGPMQIFSYTSQSLGRYAAPKYFPDVGTNHAKCTEVYPKDLAVPLNKLVLGRHPSLGDSRKSVYVAGFPVLTALRVTGKLEKRGVKVFDNSSRGENMILKIEERQELKKTLQQLANDFIVDRDYVYVSYPHLMPARVMTLVSSSSTAMRQDKNDFTIQKNNSSAVWHSKIKSLREMHMNQFGIDLNDCDTVVYALPLEGMKLKFTNKGIAINDMIWSQKVVGYPLNTCVLDMNIREEDRKRLQVQVPLKEVFGPGTGAFIMGSVDYGSHVKVKELLDNNIILVELIKTTEPDLIKVVDALNTYSTQYYPGYMCAQRLGISGLVFSRITSVLIVQSPHTDSDKTNIGLSLKKTKSNLQMVGFTKKDGNGWLYSDKAIDLVREYMDKFPDLFQYLSDNISENIFFKDKMFPNEGSAARLTDIQTWLKSLKKGEFRSTESELLEPSVVSVLEESLTAYSEEKVSLKLMKLKPHSLYLPKPELSAAAPDPEADHHILDRIVYVRECHSIPVGTKGIIIGIEKKTTKSLVCDGTGWEEAATLYDVIFDREVIGGQALFGFTKKQVYRLNKQVFINISHGKRINERAPSVHIPNAQSRTLISKGNWRDTGGGSRSNHSSQRRVQSDVMCPAYTDATAQPQQIKLAQRPSTGDRNNVKQQSGSVSNFFNAYRNSVNVNEENKSQVTMPPAPVLPNPVSLLNPGEAGNSSMNDMWNMLKNLQVQNTTKPSDVNSVGVVTENVILSQTFTRSTSSQQAPPRDSHQVGNTVQPNPLFRSANTVLRGPQPLIASKPNQFVEQTEALKKILCIKPTDNVNSLENNNFEPIKQGGRGSRSDGMRPLMEGSNLYQGQSQDHRRMNLPPQSSACGHRPSCYHHFYNMCCLFMREEPVYQVTSSLDGFIGICVLPTGYKFSGPPNKYSADEAKELMGCKGVTILKEMFGQNANAGPHNMRPLGPPNTKSFPAPSGSAPRNESNHGKRNQTWRDGQPKPPDVHKNWRQLPVDTSTQNPMRDASDNLDANQKKENSKGRNKRKVRIAANFHNPLNKN